MGAARWGGAAAHTLCPVERSTAIVGDRWTMLIVRELFAGCSRFDEMQAQTGATAQMLSARLKRLEADGMVERRIYSRRPTRYEYVLTPMGRDFFPVILAYRAWAETWCKSEGEPLAIRTTHRTCRSEVGLDGVCPTCGERVPISDLDAEPGPEYAAERRRRHEAYRARSQRPAGRRGTSAIDKRAGSTRRAANRTR
nr:helix-turn-helix domain-containing protein [Mycobacterium sp. E796]